MSLMTTKPRLVSVFLIVLAWTVACPSTQAQTPISRYLFDGDLVNEQDATLDGTFREGTSSANSVSTTAKFGVGVSGDINGALRLDGVDDWVDITVAGHPNSSAPDTGSSGPGIVSGSVTAWIRTSQSLTGEHWLIGSQNSDDQQAFQVGWNGTRLEMTANGRDAGDVTTIGDSTNDASWADGLWHHIAFTWDSLAFSSKGKVYLDGSPLTADVTADLGLGDAQTPWEFPMSIGAHNNQGTLDGFWGGMVDDLQIFARQLTDSQISSIASAITPVYLPLADFDESNVVDGGDFLIWQRNFGTGTTFEQGNATAVTGDTDIDGDDLSLWQGDYGKFVPPAPPSVSAVPEPSALAILASAMFALGASRRRS